jgi:hypothetical protein
LPMLLIMAGHILGRHLINYYYQLSVHKITRCLIPIHSQPLTLVNHSR